MSMVQERKERRKQLQLDVIRLKNEGKTNFDISKELGISETSVRVYLQKKSNV